MYAIRSYYGSQAHELVALVSGAAVMLLIAALIATPRYYMQDPVRWFRHLSDYHVDVNFTTSTATSYNFV